MSLEDLCGEKCGEASDLRRPGDGSGVEDAAGGNLWRYGTSSYAKGRVTSVRLTAIAACEDTLPAVRYVRFRSRTTRCQVGGVRGILSRAWQR
jgi:hypothetical protein